MYVAEQFPLSTVLGLQETKLRRLGPGQCLALLVFVNCSGYLMLLHCQYPCTGRALNLASN